MRKKANISDMHPYYETSEKLGYLSADRCLIAPSEYFKPNMGNHARQLHKPQQPVALRAPDPRLPTPESATSTSLAHSMFWTYCFADIPA